MNFNLTELQLFRICIQTLAIAIDPFNDLREKTESPVLKRLCFITIKELQAHKCDSSKLLLSQISVHNQISIYIH